MADEFVDIFASDSEDEDFEGFEPVADETVREINAEDIELDDDDLIEIRNELNRAQTDPSYNAYDCEWLREFDTPSAGPKHCDGDSSPYELFSKVVDGDVLALVVQQTNIYFQQYLIAKGGMDSLPRCARARAMTDVTAPEMKVFLAILLYMGWLRLPSYDSYWSTHDLVSLKITSYMTRDRFLNILSFLHAADNSQEPPRDSPDYNPGYKIAAISTMLLERWQRYYHPGREISVDETLVPFKGRTKLLQYIPTKPHKWGLKVWTLADSRSSYVYNWQLFTGQLPPDDRGRGAAHRIVVSLCEPVIDRGHHLYCDNFFTSPALFHELEEHQIGACGTLRVNRVGVPAEVKRAKPPKDNPPEVTREGNKLFITWQDKRLVHVLSTVHNGSTFTKTVRSRFHADYVREVDHPRAIQLYTKYMGGVDLADQQTSYCSNQHRMLKWWKKLFICNMLEVSVANAKVLYKELNPGKRVKTDKFRLAIISGLLDGYEKPNRPFRRPVSNPSDRLTGRHFVSLVSKVIGGGRRSNPDCEVCSDRKKKRHQTSHFCRDCEKPMCAYPCFERYHTLQNYKVECTPDLHK